MRRIQDLYESLWSVHGTEFAELDASLNPRPPTMLIDVAAELGLNERSAILDLGCGRGNHSLALAQRFGCRVYGIDLVRDPMPSQERLCFVNASAADLPFRSAYFDLVWCRDMLVHVPDLEQVFRESARALQPGGTMLIFATHATGLMGAIEARRIYEPLAIVAENLSPKYFEEAFALAGFRCRTFQRLGSELIEYYEERDGRASRELMRIARIRRGGERFRGERYEMASAAYHWVVYHLLGKLEAVIYTLEKQS